MSTEELIQRLSAEPARRQRWPLESRLAVISAVGLAGVLLIVLTVFGLRSDLGSSLLTAAGALKTVGALAVAAAAFRITCRLGRPGTPALCPVSIALVLGVLAMMAAALAASPASASNSQASILLCTAKIFMLAALPFAIALTALKAGAPVHPAMAGAMTGLLFGGLAAAGFALSCPMDDSPNIIIGYGAAMLLLAAVGAVAGRQVLAW